MQHDPARLADTRAWLDRAATDIRAAQHGMKAEPPLVADVLFHCQQAVEKCFKAFLAWHDVAFRKTTASRGWVSNACQSTARSNPWWIDRCP
jgi:HEPN domain-containing protein